MRLYSTTTPSYTASLREAILRGLAPDGGLFMPMDFPMLPPRFFENLSSASFESIGYDVTRTLIGDAIPTSALKRIIEEAVNFDAPLTALSDEDFVLELFHGETLAFKDFGARFLAQTMKHFLRDEKKDGVILAATSGDTGSAVAHAFFQMERIQVVLLYPSGKVSRIQEQQLTTLGGNVTALEILGTFDDCQRLVKSAFMDEHLQRKHFLSSANSINIGRLIPQMFYYFRAYAALLPLLKKKPLPVVFAVPSGNFGNLTAGIFAKTLGLPVEQFIAATNINSVVPEFLSGGVFKTRASVQTLSNAMDVGNPSNVARLTAFYPTVEAMRKIIFGASFTDSDTLDAMRHIHTAYHYAMDPHGAVGWLGINRFKEISRSKTLNIILETAHPAKFPEAFEQAGLPKPDVPARLNAALTKSKRSIVLPADFESFRVYLREARLL
jgi:threonine synthase